MAKQNLTNTERETHLWIAADEDAWLIFTEDKKMITLMRNRGWTKDNQKHMFGGSWYTLPRRAITIRSKESVINPKARGKGGLNK